ncbi:MAG: adenosylcobinamide-GDP ribazoletransferase [Anaerolineaceae bacterium]
MLDNFLTALGFLTILPVRLRRAPEPGDLGRAAVWFPLVGALIGVITAGGWWLFSNLFPSILASALTTSLWVILTGGLHLDGLADCCDGLFSARSKESRLEIMRDPHLGTFGALGLFLYLILKIFAVDSLPETIAMPVLIVAPAVARFFLLPAGLFTTARPDGLGFQFKDGLSRVGLLLAAVLPLAGMLLCGWWFLAAGLFSAMVGAGVLLLAKNRIGGLTGDVLGMLVETSELAFLLFLCVDLF